MPVTLADLLHEYLGAPASLEEAAERMEKLLTPKERQLLRERLTEKMNNSAAPSSGRR